MKFIKNINQFETIKLDVEVGDTLMGGKFKNKQVKVKKIGKDKNGQVTINDKPLLKFRIWKDLPKSLKNKYKLKESLSDDFKDDVKVYLAFLTDDGFEIEFSENGNLNIVRICKHIGNYKALQAFKYKDISMDVIRLASIIKNYKIRLAYLLKQDKGDFLKRETVLDVKSLDDEKEMLSFSMAFEIDNLTKLNEQNISIYDSKWEKLLPNDLTIIKADKKTNFTKGNIMLNSDMLQITYSSSEEWGYPDTLEIDIYFLEVDGRIKLDVDITYGDLVVSEFSIHDNKVDVIQYTSYHSNFDPSNTVFAFDNESLNNFINFLNRFGFRLTMSDFKFLDKIDYLPKA